MKQNTIKVTKRCTDFAKRWEWLDDKDSSQFTIRDLNGADIVSHFNADYKKLISCILRHWFGIKDNESIKIFTSAACYGNWEKIWESDEEKKQTIIYWMRELVGEIFYCQDRWTWDRLIRTQWLYQRIMYRLWLGKDTAEETEV